MDLIKKARRNSPPEQLPATKRISTPAGQRLSVVLDNDGSSAKNIRRTSLRAGIIGEVPRESMEDSSNTYSYSVWSENSGTALNREKNGPFGTIKIKNTRWKRISIILGAILLCLLGIVVGVVVAMRKKHSGSSTSSPELITSGSSGSLTSTPTNAQTGSTPTETSSIPPSAIPSGFPVGSYSMVTFLDSVYTDCTSNLDTWTCFPYTIYNDNPSESMATFNWIISRDGSSDSLTISSTQNDFGIDFTSQPLELVDAGQTSERYRFQITMAKIVKLSKSLSGDGDTQCFFNATNLQAYLYTKMSRGYPDGSMTSNAEFLEWPYAVRVEQVASGGLNVPNCWTVKNNQLGDQITDGLNAQDPGKLCSCLYKNWRTPS